MQRSQGARGRPSQPVVVLCNLARNPSASRRRWLIKLVLSPGYILRAEINFLWPSNRDCTLMWRRKLRRLLGGGREITSARPPLLFLTSTDQLEASVAMGPPRRLRRPLGRLRSSHDKLISMTEQNNEQEIAEFASKLFDLARHGDTTL